MADGTHAEVNLKGFTVYLQVPDAAEDGNPNDMVVFIDTPDDFDHELRIRINDALIYKGNPEHKIKEVVTDTLDGLHIITRKE